MSSCKICSQELIIELDPEDFNEATESAAGGSSFTVPDDLLLSCGCHFHWQCLLDESSKISTDRACPSCNTAIFTSSGQIPTKYHNEGGIQDNLDIAALVKEEAYLETNPSARPARAFLTMCSEGDVAGIVELLKAIEEDPDEVDMTPGEILRYQDPLDSMKTGLHVAIEKSQREVVWALLWLASGLPTSAFPEEVTRDAQTLGSSRQTSHGPDLRGIRDSGGRSAADIAGSLEGTWAVLLGAGFLQL